MTISKINGVVWDNVVKINGVAKTNITSINETKAPLLLDDWPGATLALGLRKLRSTYTGACIRVRRASDNAEQDIGFLGSNLDTSSLASFCSGTSGYIKTWYDQSVNEDQFTSSTNSNHPLIFSSGILDVNGAYFNGSNRLNMITPSSLGISGATARTLFGVVKRNNNGDDKWFNVENGTLTNDGTDWLLTAEFAVRIDGGNEVYSLTIPSALELATFTLEGTNVTNHTLRVNGSPITATSAVSRTMNTTQTYASLGIATYSGASTTSYVGHIGEIILYPSNKSTDRTNIENAINEYWNIY